VGFVSALGLGLAGDCAFGTSSDGRLGGTAATKEAGRIPDRPPNSPLIHASLTRAVTLILSPVGESVGVGVRWRCSNVCTCDGAYVHVYFADTHIRMWDYRAIYYELEHCHPYTIHVLTYP